MHVFACHKVIGAPCTDVLYTNAASQMFSAILYLSQFPVYDHVKHSILNRRWLEEGLPLHFISAMAAGLAAAVAANPSDIIKTRIMNQKSTGKELLIGYTINVLDIR